MTELIMLGILIIPLLMLADSYEIELERMAEAHRVKEIEDHYNRYYAGRI